MKRVILFLLSVCMLLSVASCNKKEETNEDTTEKKNESNAVTEDVCPLPNLDYELETVTIHVRGDDDSISEIGLEDEGTLLSSALYERTKKTEERLNVSIQIAEGRSWSGYSQTIRDLRSSIEAGNSSYDIIAGWALLLMRSFADASSRRSMALSGRRLSVI